GAMAAVVLTYLLAGRSGASHTLILAGIAVSSLFGAGVALALNLAPNPFAAMEVIFWLMGSLADRSMEQVWLAVPFMLLGWLCLLSCLRGLNALSLGEMTATSLGISLPSIQWRLALGVALSVGAAVSVTGSIGFVGLVVPHLLRPLVGHMPGRLLPASAFGGAILLLAADIAVRLIPTSGTELRLGVVTALIGAPFFLGLLVETRRRMV
ncbi:MAG: FecCD family ABC transporter permease, partial [Rickettsiales bacterium]